MSDLRKRARAIYNEACVMPASSVVEVIEAHLAAIRAEAKAAEREACMQIAREHQAPSVLRAIGDRAMLAAHPATKGR